MVKFLKLQEKLLNILEWIKRVTYKEEEGGGREWEEEEWDKQKTSQL